MTTNAPERLDLTTLSILDDRIAKLREDFPEVFRDGKIDFDALKRSLGEWVDPGKERFGLNWPGKAECMRVIQQPSVGTLVPDRAESVDFDTTKNMIIEGDNLEVLKLLQKSYYGKVKVIYIDPPYNTGGEFIYSDDFSEGLQNYLRVSGQMDGHGQKLSTNTESEGRYHSNWLNMMYPRLYLARNLLRDDGAIFVSIDDHEVHNLRALLNDVFGEENFIASVIWQKVYSPKNSARHFSEDHDYVVVYAKNGIDWVPGLLPRTAEADARYENLDGDPRGPWKPSDLTARNYYSNNEIWWGPKGDSMPAQKRFLSQVKQGMVPQTLWDYQSVGHTQEAKKELLDTVRFTDTENVLNSVKPTRLLQRIVQIATSSQSGDIVLDFFAGSATTGHAVMKQDAEDGGNRSYICVQFPEPLPKPEDRLKTILDIARERIAKAGCDIRSRPTLEMQGPLDVGFRAYKLTTSNFKPWDGDPANVPSVAQQIEFFADNTLPGRTAEDILTEILMKLGFELTEPVERLTLAGKAVFSVAGGALLVCLDRALTLEVIEAMAARDPAQIICLDAGFNGNDQLKVNAVQTITTRARGGDDTIVFKVV
jgi:adenine-specific DNA-methyltransferase